MTYPMYVSCSVMWGPSRVGHACWICIASYGAALCGLADPYFKGIRRVLEPNVTLCGVHLVLKLSGGAPAMNASGENA